MVSRVQNRIAAVAIRGIMALFVMAMFVWLGLPYLISAGIV